MACKSADRSLLSLQLNGYKPGKGNVLFPEQRRQLLHSPTFKACLNCISKWLEGGKNPELRAAFKRALKDVYSRLET